MIKIITSMENKRNICPVCGYPRDSKIAYFKIIDFLNTHKCSVNLCNPGGRLFRFPNIGMVQVTDMCDYCDLKILEKKIAKNRTAE